MTPKKKLTYENLYFYWKKEEHEKNVAESQVFFFKIYILIYICNFFFFPKVESQVHFTQNYSKSETINTDKPLSFYLSLSVFWIWIREENCVCLERARLAEREWGFHRKWGTCGWTAEKGCSFLRQLKNRRG